MARACARPAAIRRVRRQLFRRCRALARASLQGRRRRHARSNGRAEGMMRTLFLQAPSFEGFDGGAGSRYQARREIKSFWYPTWLAQPAALVEGSKLVDAPPHRTKLDALVATARNYDLAVLHTSSPSFI